MDLLRLWLIIHIVSAFQVYPTARAVHYHVREQGYSNTSVSLIHCKYLKHRQLYYKNSSATFQLQLLKSGDVDPNPGPTTEHEHVHRDHGATKHSTSCNRNGERTVYGRDFLLQCNLSLSCILPPLRSEIVGTVSLPKLHKWLSIGR